MSANSWPWNSRKWNLVRVPQKVVNGHQVVGVFDALEGVVGHEVVDLGPVHLGHELELFADLIRVGLLVIKRQVDSFVVPRNAERLVQVQICELVLSHSFFELLAEAPRQDQPEADGVQKHY